MDREHRGGKVEETPEDTCPEEDETMEFSSKLGGRSQGGGAFATMAAQLSATKAAQSGSPLALSLWT